MNADEMFEKLGYELKEQTKGYIRYWKKLGYSLAGDYIEFEIKNKRFRLTNITYQGNRHFRYANMQELQAINEKCKEMGWL